jgi:hypothetical protein
MPGWKAYFGLAQTPKVFRDLDEWLAAPSACVAAQALATGRHDVPGTCGARGLGDRRAQGGGQQPLLVA